MIPWLTGNQFVWAGPFGTAKFNSALAVNVAGPMANAELTIYLRVFMAKVPPKLVPPQPDATGKLVKVNVVDWKENDFTQFKNSVKAHADGFWNNTNMCLIPPSWYTELQWPGGRPTHQVNVDCRFEMVFAQGPSDAHVVIYCACIDDPNANAFTVRSFMAPSIGQLDSHDLIPVISPDAMAAAKASGNPMNPKMIQYTVAHEVGHALGLPHIGVSSAYAPCLHPKSSGGEALPFDNGARMCYLSADPNLSLNIMGVGSAISYCNSLPWLYRAARHTETSLADWRVRLDSVPPTRL